MRSNLLLSDVAHVVPCLLGCTAFSALSVAAVKTLSGQPPLPSAVFLATLVVVVATLLQAFSTATLRIEGIPLPRWAWLPPVGGALWYLSVVRPRLPAEEAEATRAPNNASRRRAHPDDDNVVWECLPGERLLVESDAGKTFIGEGPQGSRWSSAAVEAPTTLFGDPRRRNRVNTSPTAILPAILEDDETDVSEERGGVVVGVEEEVLSPRRRLRRAS